MSRREPRRGGLAAVGALALLLVAGLGVFALIQNADRARQAEAVIGGPFKLVDAVNHTVTDRDLRGHYLLIYFGYTNCPDVCPTTMGQMAVALRDLGPRAERILPIFITVDPARDTPAVIGRYVAAFGPRFIGLTGGAAPIAAAEHAYHVLVGAAAGGTAPSDGDIEHSSVLYLVAPDGHFLSPIRADIPGAAMAEAVRPFLSGSG